jgi:four helix bundle protein
MSRIERFEDLPIWKDALEIGVDIYRMTSAGALAKDFSSRDQLRRAAISISNNIAEGFECNNNKMFIKYLGYAKASAGELRSNLLVLLAANILSREEVEHLQTKLLNASKNIGGFIKYLKNCEPTTKLDPKR